MSVLADEKRTIALRIANERRMLIAGFKKDLRSGRVTIPDVMNDQPAMVAGYALLDLIKWARGGRACESLEEINAKALAECVNLLVPLGRASTRLRRFVALHWDDSPYITAGECVHGHAYTEENSYFRPGDGYRMCRKCMSARRSPRSLKAAA